MKYPAYSLSVLLTAMVFSTQADTLTIPNTFGSGTPAVAAEVNANFAAAKSAADDNDARIGNNTSAINSNSIDILNLQGTKQNRVTGACSAGFVISTINEDGSVDCVADIDSGGDIQGVIAGTGLQGGGISGTVELRPAWGAVSVHAAGFTPELPGCDLSKNSGYMFYATSSTRPSCNGVASVQLPHRATVTSLWCRVFDNDVAASSLVRLSSVALGTGASTTIFSTPSSINLTSLQTLTDYSADADAVVDNTVYSYTLYWASGSHDATSVGSYARLYNCMIYYVYQ
jgi:hypothetical protein